MGCCSGRELGNQFFNLPLMGNPLEEGSVLEFFEETPAKTVNKEKMSKSLGNILTIKEILKDWHPEVLRLFFLSHHYRSPVDYSEDSFIEAKSGLDRFYSTLNAIQEELKKPLSQKKLDSPVIENGRQAVESFQVRFEEAMDDDFNTPHALSVIFNLIRETNKAIDEKRNSVFSFSGFTQNIAFGLGGLARAMIEREELIIDLETRIGSVYRFCGFW
jgi:cysteinyl-tRNA synthetase